MKLSDVSKTAVMTLRCHAIEAQKEKPILPDPMAETCLQNLISVADKGDEILFTRKLTPALINHIVIRARKYDTVINAFIARNPGCTMVNLGCGFDTRYWRIDHANCTYIELDLPELVEIKKAALKEHLAYELLGCSVLDPVWIERVTSKGNHNFLLAAEGLFMYLPKAEVLPLFKIISERFTYSQMILEVVTEAYTRGLWKKIVEIKMRQELGPDVGSGYSFGIKNAQELETYGRGIQVIEEWSYMEDADNELHLPKFMNISRTQWTVTAAIHADG